MLTEEDKETICQYISSYAGCEVEELSRVLAVWDSAKAELFSMFGGNLRIKVRVKSNEDDVIGVKTEIAKKEPCLDIPSDNIKVFMKHLYDQPSCFQKRFLIHIGKLCIKGWVPFEDIIAVKSLFKTDCLYDNQVHIDKSYKLKYGDRQVKLLPGMKTLRAVQKVAGLYGYGDVKDIDRFLGRVSAATSVKKIDRDLVLSIHPIDYLTMSDNNSGWTTCTSWQNNGSCSEGVIEILNSCSTAVAYFENEDEEFVFNGHKIPNKSFRVLITFGPDFTLVGKSYPYGSDSMSKAILKAVDGFFRHSRKNKCERYDYFENRCKMKFITIGMYNDIKEDIDYNFWWSNSIKDSRNERFFSISGTPTCMSCGKKLTDNFLDIDGERIGGNIRYCKDCAKRECASCGHIHRYHDLKKIDVMQFFPAASTVTHKIKQVCMQCLNMDYQHIFMNSYIDKTAHTRYNNNIDYRYWNHVYKNKG